MLAILIGLASVASLVVFLMGERLIGELWLGYNVFVLFDHQFFCGEFGFFWYVMILGVLAFCALLTRNYLQRP